MNKENKNKKRNVSEQGWGGSRWGRDPARREPASPSPYDPNPPPKPFPTPPPSRLNSPSHHLPFPYDPNPPSHYSPHHQQPLPSLPISPSVHPHFPIDPYSSLPSPTHPFPINTSLHLPFPLPTPGTHSSPHQQPLPSLLPISNPSLHLQSPPPQFPPPTHPLRGLQQQQQEDAFIPYKPRILHLPYFIPHKGPTHTPGTRTQSIMSEENAEMKGEQEVDLMDELLDSAENFDELNDVSEDKANKRRKKGTDGKESLSKVKKEDAKEMAAKRAKLKEKQESSRGKREGKKKVRPNKKDGEGGEDGDKGGNGDGDVEFDTRSEASSDHQLSDDDEPSMSDASQPSSISRESSITKEEEPDEKDDSRKRKRSNSETSIKSGEDSQQRNAESQSNKKKYDYVTKINYLFRDARFFLMKSNNAENITLSKSNGVWSTPPQNEAKLNQAFREARNVILIFSIKESGRFCGFARLSGESRRDLPPVSWVLPPGLSARALGGVFQLDWISRKDLSFTKTQHLYNPWNEGKPVKIGRDGQEIEPRVAEELCRLLPKDPGINLTPVLHKSKRASHVARARGPLRRPLQQPGDRRGRPRDRGSFRGGRGDASFSRGLGRRRRYDGDDFGPRVKRLRGPPNFRGRMEKPVRSYPSERQRERSPPYRQAPRREAGSSYNGNSSSHKLWWKQRTDGHSPDLYAIANSTETYQDFMREMREFHSRTPTNLPPMAFPPPPPFDPIAPPRYYDGPPLPDYPTSRSRSEKRASADPYDRSVDEFLQRTRDRRDRSRERRYRERR
ncbi:hypothetical protein Pcinc_006707 [Petrolisthes cinctipes]|uniref:YTH domain-containing protein n=1 Tax=Petrolisthes cinctipes TaxID=88211 RepID=A0AAE1KY42_PETCI|nr:hypothetical protein Pcinc_006707 [Petrolisthes cinctipes]